MVAPSVCPMRRPDPSTVDTEWTLLDRVRSTHRAAQVWQASELQSVVEWAGLHLLETPVDVPAVSHPGPRGTQGVLFLAGPGARGVEEFALPELAAALGQSERAARLYVGEALELHDRLPRLYALVLEEVLPVWRAREIAAQTRTLSPEVAAYVDAHLSGFADKINAGRIRRCVEAALLHCDPDTARARAEAAAEARHVEVLDHLHGISTLTAVLHTPDAMALEHRITVIATWMDVLGDTAALEVRRAKALALLADPQAALAFEETCYTHARSAKNSVVECREPASGVSRPSGPQLHLHLHVHLSEAAVTGLSPVVRVEGAGRRMPIPLAAVEAWLADLAPDTTINLTPVIDLTDQIAVDAYEVPLRLQRQVEHRDLVCVFPWCGRRGRHDLDHIEPYLHPDNGGPPGQTNSHNLARLCRFHHRVKTHTHWTYQRNPHDGSYAWTSPTGATYRVDGTGTTAL